MKVVSELDSRGVVNCRGLGDIGDEPEYEATITADPYSDFSVGRWLRVFQNLCRVELVLMSGRQGFGRCLLRSQRS